MTSSVKYKSATSFSDGTQYIHPSELGSIRVHPFADSFTMLSDDRLNALAKDIAVPCQNKPTSQQHPIIIRGTRANGELLDGRNRLQACIRANVVALVTFVDLDDGKAIELISSLNNQRRQQSHRELAESAWRYRDIMVERGEKINQESLAVMFGIARRTLNKWRPGGTEAASADARKGNNNNRWPIWSAVRDVASMLSDLARSPHATPSQREETRALLAQIRRMHSDRFPHKYTH